MLSVLEEILECSANKAEKLSKGKVISDKAASKAATLAEKTFLLNRVE